MLKYFFLFLLYNYILIGQVRFASIGDYGEDGSDLQAVADLIDSLNVDFIITLGDNNYNNGAASTVDANIGKYFNKYIYPYVGTYPPGGTPDRVNRFFPTPGNHDHDNQFDLSKLQPYLDYFDLTPYSSTSGTERYYDFVWENVHFFAVNSIVVEPDGYQHPSLQSNWLEEQMNNCVLNHSHWRIVYFHHAPYSSQKQTPNLRWPFKEWGAHTVMAGHSHTYERLEVDGLTYIVNGLGGKSRYTFNDTLPQSIIRYRDKYGAMLMEVSETEMILQFINVDCELIDSTKLINSFIPVELVSFNGKFVDNNIVLEWKTETELNNQGYEIERQLGSIPSTSEHWEKIGYVPGNVNSSTPKFYSYTDSDIGNSSAFRYRLKQIDVDGTFSYSEEILVTIGTPDYFSLSQNYPNPFNPVTKIKYSIAKSGLVTIDIYNSIGEQVDLLVNENKSTGNFEVEFDGSNLPGGVYFYKLEAGNFFDVKKMTLLK